MDFSEVTKDFIERVIRIETKLDIIVNQQADAQPRISYLEKETERQKDSLARAHDRLDAHDKRYYWILGIAFSLGLALLSALKG